MKNIFTSLFILSLFTIQILSANTKLDSNDLIDLIKDPTYVAESTKLMEVMNGQMNLIYFQNNLQGEIHRYKEEFYADNLNNEELWVQLELIENKIGTYSEDSDAFVRNINTSLNSSNPNIIFLYKTNIELIYDTNDYQIKNNKLTKDLLNSLVEGDIDRYNYLISRGYLKSADFLELVSRNTRVQAEMLPETNATKYILMVDSEVHDFIAIATRVNAFQMLNELDKAKLKEYKPQLDRAYKVINKGKSYTKLMTVLQNLENSIQDVEGYGDDLTTYIEVARRVAINGKLLSDANIRNAETWKEIIDFYSRNIDDIETLYESPSRSAEFNEIQTRQSFIHEQVVKYSDIFQEAYIEFTKLTPDIINP
jgi:hypothetical protein